MTDKPTTPRLAAGEIEILQMLWREGGVTIRGAQRGLERAVGYTTVQTRLNRLVAKGVVKKSLGRPAKYAAAVQPEEVSGRHLDLLLERVSGGSVVPLVAHLVKDRTLTPEEIGQLRHLVDQAEQNQHE